MPTCSGSASCAKGHEIEGEVFLRRGSSARYLCKVGCDSLVPSEQRRWVQMLSDNPVGSEGSTELTGPPFPSGAEIKVEVKALATFQEQPLSSDVVDATLLLPGACSAT